MWRFDWFKKLRNIKKQETTLRQDGSNIDVNVDDTTSFEQSHPGVLNQVEDLSNFLYNEKGKQEIYTQSLKNLNTLEKTYDDGKMVSFIGAGTSKPLGISDWEDLMKELCEKAKDDGFNIKLSGDTCEWPQTAQDIYDHFDKNGNTKIYFDTISKNMTAKHNTTAGTLLKLVLAFDIHLTTNFDNSIEHAYKFYDYLSRQQGNQDLKKDYKTHYLPNFESNSTASDSGLICYLHGNIQNKQYILKKNEYETFYPSISGSSNGVDHLEIFLKKQYMNNNIIFLGFSFDDYYVREFFFKLAKVIERENKIVSDLYNDSEQSHRTKNIKHFLLISDNVLKVHSLKIHDVFQEFNIYPIVYKSGHHVFLERLCEVLSQRKVL